MNVGVSRATVMWPSTADRNLNCVSQHRSLSSEWIHRSISSWVPLATLPSSDSYPGYGSTSLGTSPVRSASSFGPNRKQTLIGTVMPTSEPAARVSRIAALMTPRSAPSVLLRCVYHWYFVRFVRIACWGFGIVGSSGMAQILGALRLVQLGARLP